MTEERSAGKTATQLLEEMNQKRNQLEQRRMEIERISRDKMTRIETATLLQLSARQVETLTPKLPPEALHMEPGTHRIFYSRKYFSEVAALMIEERLARFDWYPSPRLSAFERAVLRQITKEEAGKLWLKEPADLFDSIIIETMNWAPSATDAEWFLTPYYTVVKGEGTMFERIHPIYAFQKELEGIEDGAVDSKEALSNIYLKLYAREEPSLSILRLIRALCLIAKKRTKELDPIIEQWVLALRFRFQIIDLFAYTSHEMVITALKLSPNPNELTDYFTEVRLSTIRLRGELIRIAADPIGQKALKAIQPSFPNAFSLLESIINGDL